MVMQKKLCVIAPVILSIAVLVQYLQDYNEIAKHKCPWIIMALLGNMDGFRINLA